MKLDPIDIEILKRLQQDARISNKQLAGEVGISPSTCLERVRRLVTTRAITGFHAGVSPRVLGIQVQALISIRLGRHAQISFSDLMQQMLNLQEVVHVYLLAGAQDMLVHVAVRNVEHLRSLVVDKLTSHANVSHIETSLIFEFAQSPVMPNYARDVDDEENEG